MKFAKPVKATWLAELINAEILGSGESEAFGINEIHTVLPGDICFVDHPKYYSTCLNSAATHIIINSKDQEFPAGKTIYYCQDPFEAYQKIVAHFRPFEATNVMIHSSVQVGKDTVIMPNVFIGKDVCIGNNCIIYPGVCIHDYTRIGNHVTIQSNAVIGSDAFYFNTKKDQSMWYKRMHSCGDVIIEDHVEIGAGCTIARGVTASTIIGSGTKMDNLVHLGHDVVIGKNCLFAGQVGIAGATVIEDGVTLWGQVGVSKTLTIGANAMVLAKSGVPSSLEGNKTYFGTPAIEASIKRRELVWIKRIPEIWEKIKKI
ncbi:MAG: UDP-3-O-(3-hydroxymyristoyl)glucosamine N-acyltransferase [Bacteroidetes bacterium]|nr:UDP-3-O-(3-hydroxymyristoyl)glucosamine N-acyltransferase [Bacteroidota bacterium]